MEAALAQEVHVDCEGRSPHRALEQVRRDVGALRPGASVVIVRTYDDETLDHLLHWATSHQLPISVRSRGGSRVELRLFVLPHRFEGLPECSRRERRRIHGTRQTPLAGEHEFYAI